MNLLYVVLIGQIFLFYWCNLCNGADKRTKDNMPLPLAIRLILSFSLTGSAICIWLQRSICRV